MMAKDLVAVERRTLTPAQFGDLPRSRPSSNGSPTSPIPKPARAYKNDVGEFSAFTGLRHPAELRSISAGRTAWTAH
jgi:hypothetical protein